MKNNYWHFAIRGTSFCGSTIFGYVLGCLQDFSFIGESHWITSERRLPCERCGHSCSIINAHLILELEKNGGEWYETLRKALNTPYLLSSDKDPQILDKLDPTGNRVELFLFKHPAENLFSHCKTTNDEIDLCFEAYLENWIRIYTEEYKNYKTTKFFISLNDFLENPGRFITNFCGLFDLLASNVDYPNWWCHPHHTVGGNFAPWLEENSYKRIIKAPKIFQENHIPDYIISSNSYRKALEVYQKMLQSDKRITC